MSPNAPAATGQRSSPRRSALAAFLFLSAWLAALVGEAGAPPAAAPVAPTTATAPTIADSTPAPRFAHARSERAEIRWSDIGGDGAALPAAVPILPEPTPAAAPALSLSSDPLAAHAASGFRARAPPRG